MTIQPRWSDQREMWVEDVWEPCPLHVHTRGAAKHCRLCKGKNEILIEVECDPPPDTEDNIPFRFWNAPLNSLLVRAMNITNWLINRQGPAWISREPFLRKRYDQLMTVYIARAEQTKEKRQ